MSDDPENPFFVSSTKGKARDKPSRDRSSRDKPSRIDPISNDPASDNDLDKGDPASDVDPAEADPAEDNSASDEAGAATRKQTAVRFKKSVVIIPKAKLKKAPRTPDAQRIFRNFFTPARKQNAEPAPDNHVVDANPLPDPAANEEEDIADESILSVFWRRSVRFFFLACDVVITILRPASTVYMWALHGFLFLLLLQYMIIAYGGVVSYACGKPIIHLFLCPTTLSPHSDSAFIDIEERSPRLLSLTPISPASIPRLNSNANPPPQPLSAKPATFGEILGELETIALRMLSAVRRSDSPRKADLEEKLTEIVRIISMMGPGAFSYQQGVTRTVEDIAAWSMMNLHDQQAEPLLARSGAQDREFSGAPQPVSDNLDELSNEGERQVTVITRLKELISILTVIVQEEIYDAEERATIIAESMWTRLGGNRHELKRLLFWRKALKMLDKLGEDLMTYVTNLKSDWAISKAKVDDLHHRVKGLYTENGMPFQAKWRSLRAAVFRMWTGGDAGDGAQDHPESTIDEH